MTPGAQLIHSATLVDGGIRTPDAWVLFEHGRVARTGRGASWSGVRADEVHDAGGRYLTPGFVDIHAHGGAGFGFDDGDDDEVRAALAMHRAHGTTTHVLSLVTAPLEVMIARVRRLAQLAADAEDIAGLHLEGPFLAKAHCGAHDPALLRDPTPEAVAALLAAAGGQLVQVTIAPELPGAMEAIATLADAGVRAAVGHTATDDDTARDAFAGGAGILTHTFNGMPGLHHRAPGPVAAAIDAGAVLEVIADGVHVAAPMVGLLSRLAPGRVALITDAMAAAGAADGDYLLGSQHVRVTDGVARLRDGDSIAGSTLTLDRAVRFAVAEAGWTLAQAVEAATATPARTIGRSDIGHLRPGARADAVLLDQGLAPVAVWSGGRREGSARDGS